ncbi:hypothetical protein N665_0215s0009 [Sinapis alba]|nr:hypothetical protein N665_0215s0009 [Sinapis alba]
MSRFLGGLNREIQDNFEMQHYVEIEEISRARDVKCFKCQGRCHCANECTNKRVMILLDNGEFESEDERENMNQVNQQEEYEEEPIRGKLLVARRTLNLQTKNEELEQRENLFYTRCLVQEKVCSLIVDGGSCANVDMTMVVKLGLKVQKHPKPYRLQWLNEEGEMRVSNQVMVPLSIGRYEDEILLIHDGFTNKHSFEFKGKKTILVPLTPKEVYQDQLQLQKKKEIDLKPDQSKQHNFFSKTGVNDLFPHQKYHIVTNAHNLSISS